MASSYWDNLMLSQNMATEPATGSWDNPNPYGGYAGAPQADGYSYDWTLKDKVYKGGGTPTGGTPTIPIPTPEEGTNPMPTFDPTQIANQYWPMGDIPQVPQVNPGKFLFGPTDQQTGQRLIRTVDNETIADPFTGNYQPAGTTGPAPVAEWGSELMNMMGTGFAPQVGQYAREGSQEFLKNVRPGSRGFSASQNLMGKNISDAITRGYTDYMARVGTPFATDITKMASDYNLNRMGQEFETGRARGAGEQGTYNTALSQAGGALGGNIGAQASNQRAITDVLGTPGMAQILRGLMGQYLKDTGGGGTADQPAYNVGQAFLTGNYVPPTT